MIRKDETWIVVRYEPNSGSGLVFGVVDNGESVVVGTGG
jgi:hypothetical protein